MKAVRRLLVIALLVAIAAGGAWLLTRRPGGTPVASGTIETDVVHIASRYGGRVVALHAREGDTVPAGQVIAELDAAELTARRAQTAALLQELEAGPRTQDVAAAQAEWQALQAQLDFARPEAERNEKLFARQMVSASERDAAVSRADALAKSTAAAEQRFLVLKAGTRPERLAQARAQLAEFDAQLREMSIAAPAAQSLSFRAGEESKSSPPTSDVRHRSLDELGMTNSSPAAPGLGLPAPTSYVIETLNVKVGDVLAPNREVATLLIPDRLWVRVYVPELWLSHIAVGDKVRVRADGIGREFTGVVEQINRQAEFTPRNVQTVDERIRQVFGIKIRLPADTGALRPGMSVDVDFPGLPARLRPD